MRRRYDWLLDYGDEVTSDLSALHRVDDWRRVEPGRFFTLVESLWAYQGALRARLQREARDERREPRRVEPTAAEADAALADLVAAGVVSWKRG